MKIRIVSRAKHSILARAADKAGSVAALARMMDIEYPNLNDIVLLKKVGSKKWFESNPKIQSVLMDLLEEFFEYEDLFPPEASAIVATVRRQISLDVNVTMEMLQASGAIPRFLPSVDDEIQTKETAEILEKHLHSLRPREEAVLRMRYMDEPSKTLREIGSVLRISAERVRHIEASGLSKIRKRIKACEELSDYLPSQ